MSVPVSNGGKSSQVWITTRANVVIKTKNLGSNGSSLYYLRQSDPKCGVAFLLQFTVTLVLCSVVSFLKYLASRVHLPPKVTRWIRILQESRSVSASIYIGRVSPQGRGCSLHRFDRPTSQTGENEDSRSNTTHLCAAFP